jgi:hypothetical protein
VGSDNTVSKVPADEVRPFALVKIHIRKIPKSLPPQRRDLRTSESAPNSGSEKMVGKLQPQQISKRLIGVRTVLDL